MVQSCVLSFIIKCAFLLLLLKHECILQDKFIPTFFLQLTGLQPGSTYSVGVLSVSKSLWYSSPATVHDVTTLLDA